VDAARPVVVVIAVVTATAAAARRRWGIGDRRIFWNNATRLVPLLALSQRRSSGAASELQVGGSGLRLGSARPGGRDVGAAWRQRKGRQLAR
jgi:hypothetical protein